MAKTKALISFAVTVKLICIFVFAYAVCWFSHEAAHFFAGSRRVLLTCNQPLGKLPRNKAAIWWSGGIRASGNRDLKK